MYNNQSRVCIFDPTLLEGELVFLRRRFRMHNSPKRATTEGSSCTYCIKAPNVHPVNSYRLFKAAYFYATHCHSMFAELDCPFDVIKLSRK